jgi:hypothetical protein
VQEKNGRSPAASAIVIKHSTDAKSVAMLDVTILIAQIKLSDLLAIV